MFRGYRAPDDSHSLKEHCHEGQVDIFNRIYIHEVDFESLLLFSSHRI